MKAQAAIATGSDWRKALEDATAQLPMLSDGTTVDLTLLFASDDYGAALPELIAAVRKKTGGGALIGCTASARLGNSASSRLRNIALKIASTLCSAPGGFSPTFVRNRSSRPTSYIVG